MFFDDHIDGTKHELRNWVVQILAADPVSPVESQIYYNSVSKKLRQYNGTTWTEYSSGAGTGDVTQAANSGSSGRLKVSAGADKSITDYATAGIIKSDASGVVSAAVVGTDYVTAASTNTLTNKTFDANGTGNALSNVETADLAAGVLNTSSTLAGATAAQVPSALAVSQAIASAVAGVAKPMGGIDCSTNPNYPAANVGEYYRVTVAGLIGGASGTAVQVGDEIHCFVTGAAGTQAVVGANWTVVQANVDQATTATLGLVALATNVEALAKANTTKAVTPSALVGFATVTNTQFGNGALTSFVFAHGRGSIAVTADVYDVASNEKRYPKIVIDATNVTVSGYLTAPTTNQFRAVIVG